MAVKKSFFGINGNVDINAEEIEYIKDAFSGMEISVLGSYIDIITEWIKKEKSYISIIREEERSEYASEDLAFMKRIFL